MKPAVGYYRVSTEDQTRGISPEMQPDKVRQYAALYDYALREPLFHDDGLSARSTRKRPEVLRAVGLASQLKGALIVYSLSRFIRNTEEGLAIERQLRNAEATLCSVTEYFDTRTPNGLFVFTILLAKDQLESGQTSQRTRDCLQACKRLNRITSSEAMYGYQRDLSRPEINRKTKQPYFPHLIANPSEHAVIALIRKWRSGGATYEAIMDRLNAEHVHARSGGRWYKSSIHAICAKINGGQ